MFRIPGKGDEMKTIFKYEGSRGYWSTTGYPANSIVHVLAGEFGK